MTKNEPIYHVEDELIDENFEVLLEHDQLISFYSKIVPKHYFIFFHSEDLCSQLSD